MSHALVATERAGNTARLFEPAIFPSWVQLAGQQVYLARWSARFPVRPALLYCPLRALKAHGRTLHGGSPTFVAAHAPLCRSGFQPLDEDSDGATANNATEPEAARPIELTLEVRARVQHGSGCSVEHWQSVWVQRGSGCGVEHWHSVWVQRGSGCGAEHWQSVWAWVWCRDTVKCEGPAGCMNGCKAGAVQPQFCGETHRPPGSAGHLQLQDLMQCVGLHQRKGRWQRSMQSRPQLYA